MMEERTSQLETEVGFLKEQLKMLLDQNSSKPQTVVKCKSKVCHSKWKFGRSLTVSARAPAPVDILPPQMLQMVMEKLDTNSMKNSRLVCRKWNVHATPVLANRTTINVCKFFRVEMTSFHRKITAGLIRNVNGVKEPDSEIILLTEFCQKYGNEVKGLKTDGWFFEDYENLLFLYRILTELCLNLQELHVVGICYHNKHKQMSFEFSKPLALKVLRLCKQFDADDDDESPLFNFLENVILASKKLETLEVDLEYCPKDLSKLTALKNLELRQISFSEIKNIKFPSQLYFQKSCIENFTVFVPDEMNSQSNDKTTEKYQQFPALRNLMIKSQYEGKLKPSNFAYYMLERSPKLESLTIDADGAANNVQVLTDLFHTKPIRRIFWSLATVKFLWINFEDEDFFQSIMNLTNFPNLTTLEFSIGKYASLQNDERDRKVSGWFGILSKLKLVHLNLSINCKIKMSTIACGISANPSLFRGLETLKITFRDQHFGADDLHESPKQMAEFKKALKMTSTLKQAKFVGFQMRCSTSKKLLDFVTKNRLPVEID